MMSEDTGNIWSKLEKRSSLMFLIAGVILLVYASLLTIDNLVFNAPYFHDRHAGFIGPFGFFIGFVGLLGLYKSIQPIGGKLVKASLIFGIFGVVGWFFTSLFALLEFLGAIIPDGLQAIGFLAIFGTLFGYSLFAITIKKGQQNHPHNLYLWLTALPLLFIILIISGAITGGTGTGAMIVSSLHMITHIGIGIKLRSNSMFTLNSSSIPSST